jgi:hypothetical protein
LPPTSVNNGARFELVLDHADGAKATYRAAIHTPEHTYEGRAVLGDDGAVTLSIDAPAELAGKLEMFAKLTARGASKRRDDGLAAWPARVLRWRP